MQRAHVIAGQQVILSVLGAPLEPLFEQFYAAYFGQRPLPWEELDAAARDYFDQHPTSAVAHDDYFNNFISVWRLILSVGAFPDAETVWTRALQPALAWEQAHPGQRLHKGTPYYFWAMTAILRRDMDRGYLIIHKALQEDIDTTGQQTPDTPGYALVSLNHERTDQAFRAWVVLQAEHLQHLLDNYNATHNRRVTLADVRQKFLNNPPSTDTLFLLTYTLARLININDAPDHTRMNSFAGQLELNLLFDVTLVIDNAIKDKNPAGQYFSQHAQHLLAQAGDALTINQLQTDVNGQFRNDFDATLQAALDGAFTLQSGVALSRLQCDAALAYGIRNHGAHNTGTATTIWQRFPEVQQALFRTFFAVIDHLY